MIDIYYLTFGLLAYLGFINRKNSLSFIIALVPLLAIVVFRYGVGADYFSYEHIYTLNTGKTIQEARAVFPNIDYGYLAIGYVFQLIGVPFELYFIIITAIITLFITLWIKDNSSNPVLSIFLFYAMFFFVWNLSAIRQGLVLSMGLYFVFNKKLPLATPLKVGIILLLSLLHSSGLILLLLLMFAKLSLSKKAHLLILVLSLLVTYLPIDLIFVQLQFIPGVSRFLEYLSEGSGFMNFAGISRLILYVAVYLHYDKLTEEYQGELNIYLLGLCVYFVSSFSQVAAGRFGIYSLVFLTILSPAILDLYSSNQKLKVVASLGLFAFSATYFMKEMDTLVEQTGLMIDSKVVPFTNYFNKSEHKFDNYFYVYNQRGYKALEQYSQFMKDFKEHSKEIHTPLATDSFIAVLDTEINEYVILNQKGQKVTDQTFKTEPKMYHQYIKYIPDPAKSDVYFIDLVNNVELKDANMISEINSALRIEKVATKVEDLTTEELQVLLADTGLKFDRIKDAKLSTYDLPSRYYIITMEYYYSKIQYVLDSNKDILINDYYYSSSRFDSNHFFQLETNETTEFYNFNGTKVWMVKK